MTTWWDFRGDLRIKRNYRVNMARDLKNSSNMTAHKKNSKGAQKQKYGQWNRRKERPEIKPLTYGQLIYQKVARV